MTVPTDMTPMVQYTANGSTNEFPITFAFIDDTDIKASHNDTDLELNGPDENSFTISSGSVVTATLYDSGTITIYRETPKIQGVTCKPNQALPADIMEAGLDRPILIAQELGYELNRSLVYSPEYTGERFPAEDIVANAVEQATIAAVASVQEINLSDALHVDNMAALALIDGGNTSGKATVHGFYLPGDGAGGPFVWDDDSTEDEIPGMIVQATGVETGRWKRDYSGKVSVLWTGAKGIGLTGAAYDTPAFKAAFDNYTNIHIPKRQKAYALSDEIVVRPKTHVTGDGVDEYMFTDRDVKGTVIIQTVAKPIFTTDIDDPATSRFGDIYIEDMTLLGGLVASPVGTYGIYCTSSCGLRLKNVWGKFFVEDGLYCSGSLLPLLIGCKFEYNQNAGINFDYGLLSGAEEANSYMATIFGGGVSQNKNYGILLGESTVKVNIIGPDIESNGSYYPSGLGIGIGITGTARNVSIEGCWLEGNKLHLDIGGTSSVNTVPENTRVKDCQFWSLISGTTKIKFNSGRDPILDNCQFFGGGDIYVGSIAGNPKIYNCSGGYRVTGPGSSVITELSQDITNAFAYSDMTLAGAWSTYHCTITKEHLPSPAGKLPVYKITPTQTGVVSWECASTAMSYFSNRHTVGFYMRTDSVLEPLLWPCLYSAKPKYYTSDSVDTYPIKNKWQWVAYGRQADADDAGNKKLTFQTTVTTLDPIYVSGLVILPGIVDEPYRHNTSGISTLAVASSPSVYGVENAVTGGALTIANFTGAVAGQTLKLLAQHAVTLTNGTNMYFNGNTDYVMGVGDTVELLQYTDGKWYETGRSNNL